MPDFIGHVAPDNSVSLNIPTTSKTTYKFQVIAFFGLFSVGITISRLFFTTVVKQEAIFFAQPPDRCPWPGLPRWRPRSGPSRGHARRPEPVVRAPGLRP